MANYSKDGEAKTLRPRRPRIGGGKPTSEKVGSFSRDGERKRFNSEGGENRPRRSFGGPRREGGYGHSSENGERRPYRSNSDENTERRPYRNSEGGENRPRRSFGGPRREGGYGHSSENGERRPYRSAEGGENRPRRSFGGPRREGSYGHSSENGERRPYRSNSGENTERRPYRSNSAPRRPFQKKYEFSRRDDEAMDTILSSKPQLNSEAYSDYDYAESPMKDEIRLNKFIANSGVCSRREADTYIEAGVVTVNGEVVTELGTKINVLNDDVRFNGERLHGEEKVYLVLNKPKGYVTTASDPHAEKTVMDLIKGCKGRVFPVGRLDKATTGVIMFTNDGEIAERLTHPSYNKKKIYQVLIDHELTDEDYNKIKEGVTLTDGPVNADELEYLDPNDHRKLGIEIHSGKNRIVRRIFESLGYDVKALDRVYFAGLTKKGLQKGEWRYLTEGEVNILKMGAYA